MNYLFTRGTEDHARHLFWLKDHLQLSQVWDFEKTVSLGIYEDGEILAVVVYHDYSLDQQSMNMSGGSISPKWMTRKTLHLIHKYIFEDAQCRLAIMQVSEQNHRMLKLARGFGYSTTNIPDLRAEGEDDVVCILKKSDWLENKFALQ